MDNELFEYSPIIERPPIRWPGGARVAAATGARPGGWLGPGLTETFQTPMLLSELGLLYADAERGGRVMALALHPFVTGQAFRHKYLDQALAYLAAQPGIWLTTSDDIAEHDRRATGS